MAKALIDFFDYREVLPYLRDRVGPEYLTEAILPPLPINSLRYEHLIGEFYEPIIGSFSAFGANNVFVGRDGVKKFLEELRPIRLAQKLDGKLFVEYRNSPTLDPLVQALFNDIGNMYDGVRARAEKMRVQVLTTGELVVDENDVKFTVDYDIPATNRLVPATLWSDTTNSDPVADMLNWRQNLAFEPDGAIVSRQIANNVLANENVRTQIYGLTFANRPLSMRDLNGFLSSVELPVFIINDDRFRDLNKTQRRFWPNDKLVWVGRNIGRTVLGPTEESTLGLGIVRADNGIYVQVYEQEQPPAIITTASATALVALPGAHELVIITPV